VETYSRETIIDSVEQSSSSNLAPSPESLSLFRRIIDDNRICLLRMLPESSLISIQAIIDGPTTGVLHQSYSYKHLTLTPLKLSDLPRGAGTKKVRKEVEKEAIVEKWDKSSWAQKRVAVQKRRALTDFGRFSVMLAKKQRRVLVRKTVAKA